MNNIKKILLIITIILLRFSVSEAQTTIIDKDSLGIKEQKNTDSKTQGKSQSSQNAKVIKQVRSARPDMSRVNGARPPSVVRQSGSGIPKGFGKPGGAKGPGRG